MKMHILKFASSFLVITSGIAEAATTPVCTVTFDKEVPVIANVIEQQGKSKVLIAESKLWLQGSGARVEIEYLVSDGNLSPLTVVFHSQRGLQTISEGGNTIQVPVVEPLRRQYWFNPIEGLQIKGPSDEPVAFVKCDKQF